MNTVTITEMCRPEDRSDTPLEHAATREPANRVEEWPAYWHDEIFLNGRVQVAARTAVAVGGLLAVASGCAVGVAWEH